MKHYKIVKIVQKDVDVFELFLQVTKDEEIVKENIVVSGQVLSTLGIIKPTEISQELYVSLCEQKLYYQAYNHAIGYLSYRKRSVEEVRKHLVEKDAYSDAIINQVLKKLIEQNYLNDLDFIKSYITTALKTTFKGPQKLKNELTGLGCAGCEIDEVMTKEFTLVKQEAQLQKLFEKLQKKKYVSQQQMLDKYNQKAIELGYSYELINQTKANNNNTNVAVDKAKIMRLLEKDLHKLQKKEHSNYEIKQKMKQKLLSKRMSYDEAESYLKEFMEQKNLHE